MNQFVFNDKRSYDDLHMIITAAPTETAPKRRLSFTNIKGRDGALIDDEGAYDNIQREYKVAVFADNITQLQERISKIRGSILTVFEYTELFDTYDDKYFYMAVCKSISDFTIRAGQIAEGSIIFNCEPYKYDFSGKETLTYKESFELFNAEQLEAKPVILLSAVPEGTACSIAVNDKLFSFPQGFPGAIVLDCETMTVTSGLGGTTGMNSRIDFYEFPSLIPGNNRIDFDNTVIHAISIMPRWRKL